MNENKRFQEDGIRKESICGENVCDEAVCEKGCSEEIAGEMGDSEKGPDESEIDLGWFIEALVEAARERDFKPDLELASEPSHASEPAPESLGMLIPSDSFRAYGKPGYYGRPIERIDPFLEELGRFWKKHPDWRFGQLMCNLDRRYRAQHNGCDFFCLEEDDFLAFLEDCED